MNQDKASPPSSPLGSLIHYTGAILLTILTLVGFLVPQAKGFPNPELARMIFFHLPCAFITVVFVIFATYCAVRYLMSRELIWEHRSVAATEMATTTAAATMITGILFSRVQWGAWWHWDPRQTSFLIVLLLMGTYFAIRMAFEDETARARASAVFSTLSIVPILFLIFVFPRLPQVVTKSLHPSTTVQSGGFSSDYWSVVAGTFVVLIGFCIWLYRMHVRASIIENLARDRNGKLDAGRRTTARRVDSDLFVHKES